MNDQPCRSAVKTNGEAHPIPVIITLSDHSPTHLQPLDTQELSTLKQCEDVLRKGLDTFFEVGQALLTIREGRLYRGTHSSFEAYCRNYWSMGRSHASHLIGAAERLKLLPPESKIPRPTNEFQIRPFLKLEPSVFPKVWEQAVARAKDGPVTFHLAQAVVAEINPKRPKRITRHSQRRSFSKKCMPGEVLALLHRLKRKVDDQEKSEALELIERIESLLFRE